MFTDGSGSECLGRSRSKVIWRGLRGGLMDGIFGRSGLQICSKNI